MSAGDHRAADVAPSSPSGARRAHLTPPEAGEMGRLMARVDWAATPLGPRERWPSSLQTAVSIVLAAKFPMLLLWGREYIQTYNDAFRPILGAMKHPAALGQPARDCWPEIWDAMLAPMFAQVMASGEAIWSEDLPIPLDRNGYLEETFFTFSYSAVRDESGSPGGILVTCVETTARVIGERRLRTLRELAAQASSVQRVADACQTAAATLAANPHDVPFALIYLAEGDTARLVGQAGLPAGHPAAAPRLAGDREDAGVWPQASAAAGDSAPRVVTELAARLRDMPGGPWPEPADAAAVLPIAHSGRAQPLGTLVAGISPRLAFDAAYRSFCELIAAQVATAITAARAYEAERERAEALAQLDRAKTVFFSNVSHEFRTPLTLMLGPTEAALREGGGALQGEALAMVHRNQVRLLHLVNALLDFSRVEAGRAQAVYRLTDLGEATREVAGAFRSAIESAGLAFDVACEPIAAPVYVDEGMWEKIVLNLLSNALKFTLAGSIRLRLGADGDHAVLTVSDTGSGIPASELPRVFDRFHRVEGTPARTYEGSGIGLALTQELVRLHGGTMAVESREREGTTFTVRMPCGSAHLPADRVETAPAAIDVAGTAAPFVQEAMRWQAAAPEAPSSDEEAIEHEGAARRDRILVVDDNADMRDYLSQLLRGWTVETATSGVAALERIRRAPPDLVVTDVMMPGMDGFGLLRELRANPATRGIPVLMLSARATEDARISGFDAGADDYLVKPFSGRELVARVRSLLTIARARREAELQKQHLRALFMQAPTPAVVLTGPQHVIDLANPLTCLIWGRDESEIVGRPLLEALPELRGQPFVELLDLVLRTGGAHVGKEVPARLDRRGDGTFETVYFNFVYAPLRGVDAAVEGVLVLAFDVTDEVRSRDEMNRLRAAAEAASRAKDEFLAMLGHELRNPLAPILTALQLMRLRGDTGGERERTVIDRQVRHLVRLVDDLLDVSRIARGKIELRPRPVELGEIVASALEAAAPLLEEQQHVLEVDVSDAGLLVQGDVIRLTQVVMNMLTNAAKYTKPQGRIRVTAAREGTEVVLRVSDTGIGISAEMLPRIFDMFTQARQDIDRSEGGLGLGLTIVRSLVRLHGGTVEARSEGLGTGSEFIVRLPAIAAEAALGPSAAREPGEVPSRARAGRRVLVVDDNADAARLMAEALAALGHEVRVAFDGPAAIEEAGAFRPEVAVLDLGLPLMDGFELARQLRAQAGPAPIALVAVTGYGQLSDQQRTAAAGFQAHLVKPVDLDTLARELDRLVVAE